MCCVQSADVRYVTCENASIMVHLVLLAVVLSSLYLAHGGLPTAEPPKSSCPDGWSYCPAASRCYKWTDGAFTQPEAKSQCRTLGGNLATIDSAAATQCLLDYAGKSSQEATSAWIGLADTEENSKHTANCTCWKWLDGSSFSFENFAPGQPNNAEAKEWCTEVFLPGSNYPPGTWNDELCEAYKRPALCSVPAAPMPSTTNAVTTTAVTTEPPCGPPQQTAEPSPATGSPTSPTKATTHIASTAEPPCPCELGTSPTGPTRPRTTRASPIPSRASKPSRPPKPTPRATPKPSRRTRATTKAAKVSTSATTLRCPAGWVHCRKASKCYK
ncbi:Lectin precursor, partial [Aphelenchoides avenae]